MRLHCPRLRSRRRLPDAVNDTPAWITPAAQTPAANGKNAKPALDKSDESSSKHKPKKGLGKLNPF